MGLRFGTTYNKFFQLLLLPNKNLNVYYLDTLYHIIKFIFLNLFKKN